MKIKSKNKDILSDFSIYCFQHPEQRFWQALRNWAGVGFILVSDTNCGEPEDTFYWEGKSK